MGPKNRSVPIGLYLNTGPLNYLVFLSAYQKFAGVEFARTLPDEGNKARAFSNAPDFGPLSALVTSFMLINLPSGLIPA